MAQYFELHVFLSRKEGYSVPMVILDRTPEQSYDEDEIIDIAVQQNVLDAGDADMVDTVDEISEHEYSELKQA